MDDTQEKLEQHFPRASKSLLKEVAKACDEHPELLEYLLNPNTRADLYSQSKFLESDNKR